MCEKIGNDWQTERNKKKRFAYSSNTSWIACKAKIIHHDRIFAIWTTSPYTSESRSQYQKWQFTLDNIDNIFISLAFFDSYFGDKMIMKKWSFVTFTTYYRKSQWGKGSIYVQHSLPSCYNSFSYLACAWKGFFQQANFSVRKN